MAESLGAASDRRRRFARWEWIRFAAALAAVLCMACAAWPAPIYGGAVRQISATAGPFGGFSNSDVDSTNLLGAWVEAVSTSYSSGNINAIAWASMDSLIDPDGILLSGSLAAQSTLGGVANAQSILSVSFQLLQATPYFSDITGAPFQFSLANNATAYAADSSGILPIGNYSLTVRFQAGAGPSAGSSDTPYQYTLLFAPSPGAAWFMIGGVLFWRGRTRRGSRRS